MLPGYNGHLVSESFLETELLPRTSEAPLAQAETGRKRIASLRPACEWLGPASSIQTLLAAAAEPLLEALGFDTPTTITARNASLVATIRAGSQPVVLVLIQWGERLDSVWRLAVTEAIQRAA